MPLADGLGYRQQVTSGVALELIERLRLSVQAAAQRHAGDGPPRPLPRRLGWLAVLLCAAWLVPLALNLFRLDLIENRRLDKEALVVDAASQAIATAQELGAFFPGDLDILEIGLKLVGIHCRAHLYTRLNAVAHFQGLDFGHQFFNQRFVNVSLNDAATAGGTLLPGGEE